MKEKARIGFSRQAALLLVAVVSAVLMLGGLTACASGGSKTPAADEATMATKTLVKTASNEMTLVQWDVSADDSPLTVSSDDPRFAEYVGALGEITGFNIENLSMQVRITEFAGAEIGATHENVTDNIYTIESLEAVVDGQPITYAEGDFK